MCGLMPKQSSFSCSFPTERSWPAPGALQRQRSVVQHTAYIQSLSPSHLQLLTPHNLHLNLHFPSAWYRKHFQVTFDACCHNQILTPVWTEIAIIWYNTPAFIISHEGISQQFTLPALDRRVEADLQANEVEIYHLNMKSRDQRPSLHPWHKIKWSKERQYW